MFYMFVGLMLAVGLAVVFALLVTFAVSIVIGVLYFAGLIFLIIRTKLLSKELLIRVHFNMALILKNENNNHYYR